MQVAPYIDTDTFALPGVHTGSTLTSIPHHGFNNTVPTQRESLPHTSYADKENYIMSLTEKYGSLPSGSRADTRSIRKHIRPDKKEVLRSDLFPEHLDPALRTQFDFQGNTDGDRERARIKQVKYQMRDGRTDAFGNFTDTTATGQLTQPRELPFDALKSSRQTEAVRRYTMAPARERSILEYKMGRSGGLASQNHMSRDTAVSASIMRRQSGGAQRKAILTGVGFERTYIAPENITVRSVMNSHEGRQRVQIDGLYKIDRPMIENVVKPRMKPRVTELRTPNPSSNTFMVGAPLLGSSSSGGQMITSHQAYDRGNVYERRYGQVADNRASRQAVIETTNAGWDHSFSAESYIRKYSAKAISVDHQRLFDQAQLQNKVTAIRNPQILRDYNAAKLNHRNVDMRRL